MNGCDKIKLTGYPYRGTYKATKMSSNGHFYRSFISESDIFWPPLVK